MLSEKKRWVVSNRITAYDADWQWPAITEEHAYRVMQDRESALPQGVHYLAFPWATLIDGVNRRQEIGRKLQEVLSFAKELVPADDRVITVCQHIKFKNFMHLMKEVGITDLYASHCTPQDKCINGIRIHPFPLYPVAIPEQQGKKWERRFSFEDFSRRPHLYSFVGAYDPRYYMSDTRQKLSNLPQIEGLIRILDAWHFERRVYDVQILGGVENPEVAEEERRREEEYSDLLRSTKFSLCPVGTGPNTIRLWESVEAGAIPVLFGDYLELPGGEALWREACVFVQDTSAAIEALPRKLEEIALDRGQMERKLKALKAVRIRYGRDNFIAPILETVNSPAPCSMKARSDLASIWLDLRGLTEPEQISWLLYTARLGKCGEKLACIRAYVGEDESLRKRISKFTTSFMEREFAPVQMVETFDLPIGKGNFAYLTSSMSLNTRFLKEIDDVYLCPSSSPDAICEEVYLNEVANRIIGGVIENLLKRRSSFARRLLNWYEGLDASQRKVTLVTSVFAGDKFLPGFLDNSSALKQYHQCEHLLIRAASPGEEHQKLVDYVNENPTATYINLAKDPGLYGVWNLASRICNGKYISNANLDDRRSPDHVVQVTQHLEDNGVEVASAALRVTEKENTPWHGSEGLVEWYTSRNDPNGVYPWAWLHRKTEDGRIVSRNLPHCMPVWCRGLFAMYGNFREKEYGPSADWEFWLRCGAGGAAFSFLKIPLGVYLKSPASYWRKNPEGAVFDRRIADHHVGNMGDVKDRPFILELKEVHELVVSGAKFELLVRLLCLSRRNLADDERELLGAYLSNHFGLSLVDLSLDDISLSSLSKKPYWLFSLIQQARDAQSFSDHEISWRTVVATAAQIYGLHIGLIVWAYLRFRAGETEKAWDLLRSARKKSARDFWSLAKSCFRADSSLDEMQAGLDGRAVAQRQMIPPSKLRVFFYPDYTHGNAYQKLLYADLVSQGGCVVGLNSLSGLLEAHLDENFCNVVHIHWINALFKGASADDYGRIGSEFLSTLETLKGAGYRIAWSVHNYINHESAAPDVEKFVRHRLSEIVDIVYLHHPMIKDSLDWLSPKSKTVVVEHGSYSPDENWLHMKQQARIVLGIEPDARVIVCAGQIREYKDFGRYIPALNEWLHVDSRNRLFIVGRISAPDVAQKLSEIDSDRLVVKNQFVSDLELDTYLYAADLGFLSYRSILTSGTLFHMFSRALPVIGPEKGTIPAYLYDGWNGRVYSSEEELRTVLQDFGKMNKRALLRWSQRAVDQAKSMKWSWSFFEA